MSHFTPGLTDAGKPRAAVGAFPYEGHRTLAEHCEWETAQKRRIAHARSCRKAKGA